MSTVAPYTIEFWNLNCHFRIASRERNFNLINSSRNQQKQKASASCPVAMTPSIQMAAARPQSPRHCPGTPQTLGPGYSHWLANSSRCLRPFRRDSGIHLPNLKKGESHKLNQSPQRTLWPSVFHLENPLGGCKDNRGKKKTVSFETRILERYFKYNHLGAGHLEEEK